MMSVENLASYLPDLVLRRFAANPTPLRRPEMDRFPAAVLFADIQGFMPLVERFMHRGPIGNEDLTDLLNAYFGQLIEILTAHGGDIVKMAGDALVAIWPVSPEEDLAAVTWRATQCSLTVQSALNDYAMSEEVRLFLRVVVAAGEVAAMYVGGILDRWELLLAGAPFVQMGMAQKQAQPGDVVLSRQAWELVHSRCSGIPLDLGNVRLASVNDRLSLRAASPVQLSPRAETAISVCVPAAITHRIATGPVGWLDELRRVTVLFVNLPALNHTTVSALEQAQAVMQALQIVLYRYEGSVNKLMVDDKGITLIAAMGLPPLAHEDDPVRGIQAAQAIQGKLREWDMTHAIGVATGRVFCGVVGSARRREYTMNGEVMPLVARLMQAAYNDILCDAATYQAARARLGFEILPPITVKGRLEPVPIYRPQSENASAGIQPPMLGRERERRLLASRLEALQAGQSGLVLIEGEAGIGKSRLVHDLIDQARTRGLQTLIGTGDAIENGTLYYAWRPIFNQLLGLEGLTEPEGRRQHILDQLRAEPDLPRLAPLLNSVLASDFAENEITMHLSGQVRADNIQELLLRLLHSATQQWPMILVLEDAHWLDSASWRLISLVSQRANPVLLIVAMRPAVGPASSDYDRLVHEPNVQRLLLDALPPEETLALVCQRLEVAQLPSSVAALILRKAQGNPFFSEELAYALRDAGLILLLNGTCQVAPNVDLDTVPFPENIQGVITSRIDRLPPPAQMALKAASIIGQVFPLSLLSAIYPLESEKARLRDHLSLLEGRDILFPESSLIDPAYGFKHIIIQEATYNLMLFAQRRQLHAAVAEWYERNHTDLSPFYASLAHHWSQAQEVAKTLDYLEKAGEQALLSGSYQEAVQFLSKALRLASENPPAPGSPSRPVERDARRARWERQLGEAYAGIGHSAQSRQHLEQAAAQLGCPVPAARKELVLRLLKQSLRLVLPGGRPRSTRPRHARAAGIAEEAALTYERLAEIYYIANDPLLLIDAMLHSSNFAKSAGDAPVLARAYANMSLVAGLVPLHSLAESYRRRAFEIATQADLPSLGWVGTVTSVYDVGIGQWKRGREALNRTIEIYERLNDRAHWRESVAILAEIDYHQGDFRRSAQRYQDIYASAKSSGNAQAQVWGLLGLAQSALIEDQIEQAITWLEGAATVAATSLKEHTDPPNDVLTHGLLALARLRCEESERALQEARMALQLITRLPPAYVAAMQGYASVAEVFLRFWEAGSQTPAAETEAVRQEALSACSALRKFARVFPIAWPRALLLQGRADLLAGRPARARRAWRQSLRMATRFTMPLEQALAHYALGQHRMLDDSARHGHLKQAHAIFTRLEARHYLTQTQTAAEP